MKTLLVLICVVNIVLTGCGDVSTTDEKTVNNQAQEYVDKAISAMGGSILDNAVVSFKFRTRTFEFWQKEGQYRYTRTHVDTSGSTSIDVLTNDDLVRSIDKVNVNLDSTWKQRYSNSVNSVIYFAFLPYRLNDPAVIKTYNGLREINSKNYHEVKIQFAKEGGGVDHDDNFLYWFDEDNFALDFMAYDYITDGGGVRFREAINRRNVNGLVIQDYVNYKPTAKSTGLHEMLDAYKNKSIVELSKIELEDVRVEKLPSN